MPNIFVKINGKTIYLRMENDEMISIKEICYVAFNKYFSKYYPNTIELTENPFKLKNYNNFLKMGYLKLDINKYVRFKEMNQKIDLNDYNEKTLTFNFTFPGVNEKFTSKDINEIVKIDFTKFS